MYANMNHHAPRDATCPTRSLRRTPVRTGYPTNPCEVLQNLPEFVVPIVAILIHIGIHSLAALLPLHRRYEVDLLQHAFNPRLRELLIQIEAPPHQGADAAELIHRDRAHGGSEH